MSGPCSAQRAQPGHRPGSLEPSQGSLPAAFSSELPWKSDFCEPAVSCLVVGVSPATVIFVLTEHRPLPGTLRHSMSSH